MSAATRGFRAVARLDFSEVVRSRWLRFSGAVYVALAAIFVLVGMRESTVVRFTGMSRVLLNFSHALVLLLPLLALTATGQVINRARDEGTLELLFSQPIPRRIYFTAVSLNRTLCLIVPLAVLMVLMAVYGALAFHQPIAWGFLGSAVLVSGALLWAFAGIGLAVSTLVRDQAKALIWLLLIWAVAVALLDFALVGLLLQRRINHQTLLVLASVNPVQTARVALLMAADPDLTWLGPVGFWLAHRLSPAAVMSIGVAWPVVVGTGSWCFALFRFRRGDVV